MKTIAFFALAFMFATIGFGAEPIKPDAAAKRAETLKANVKDFQLRLSYLGQSDKPYYTLLLSVPPVAVKASSAFSLVAKIDEAQALKIIDHLATTGILARAAGKDETLKLPQTGYKLTVMGGDLELTEALSWDLDGLARLDGLRKVLEGDTAKDMDTLLTRLSGHRRVWEESAKKPAGN